VKGKVKHSTNYTQKKKKKKRLSVFSVRVSAVSSNGLVLSVYLTNKKLYNNEVCQHSYVIRLKAHGSSLGSVTDYTF
jgi:hypothetical protein